MCKSGTEATCADSLRAMLSVVMRIRVQRVLYVDAGQRHLVGSKN
jgi:hypothetical protein